MHVTINELITTIYKMALETSLLTG